MSDVDMTQDLKQSIIKNVLDKKFSRANAEFATMMRDKAVSAIADFKNAFKYVSPNDEKEVEGEPQEKEVKKK